MTPTCDNPSGMANMGMCQPADCSINTCGGELVCVAGVQMCTLVTGLDNTCNGVDEDCDEKVDEGWLCTDPDGPDNIPGNAETALDALSPCANTAPGSGRSGSVLSSSSRSYSSGFSHLRQGPWSEANR
jgi:hypothetical protein